MLPTPVWAICRPEIELDVADWPMPTVNDGRLPLPVQRIVAIPEVTVGAPTKTS